MINLANTKSKKSISLLLNKANRHGLITGATGTGKTVTMQSLVEGLSANGVPCFCADVKGDLSGVSVAGDGNAFPVQFWDIFGKKGLPIHTSVEAMGPEMLSSMLRLNETQSGAMAICFKKSRTEASFMLDLDDLRWELNDMIETREDVCKDYGNVTAASLSAIQRNVLALEAQGGYNLFGEPPFDIVDFMQTDDSGRGVINLLQADQLMECPKLYATFLLWMLTELFRTLPEVGDVDKPKMVFFFDEAHLLFQDAPKPLLQQIERLVRLIRSKGVGVFFVTQSPKDVPEAVLAQLGNRVQHALRAFTPGDRRMIKAAADAFRPNPSIDVRSTITELGIGQALVSFLRSDGTPTPVEIAKINKPKAQIGPITDLERSTMVETGKLFEKYGAPLSGEVTQHNFANRCRNKHGLETVAEPAEYQEGIYKDFLLENYSGEAVQAGDKSLSIKWLEFIAWGSAAAAIWGYLFAF